LAHINGLYSTRTLAIPEEKFEMISMFPCHSGFRLGFLAPHRAGGKAWRNLNAIFLLYTNEIIIILIKKLRKSVCKIMQDESKRKALPFILC